jgi:hypothetical protein
LLTYLLHIFLFFGVKDSHRSGCLMYRVITISMYKNYT